MFHLMSQAMPIGCVSVTRKEPGAFNPDDIQLLQTFADQGVIAIENTRLFEAEQASKRELQESLEFQTATSEVLNVISRSPTELQPVLDAIAATAARLCESMNAIVWRVAGGWVRVVAQFGSPTNSSALPVARGSITGRAIVDRKTIHVHDLAAMVETEYPDVKETQRRVGHRTVLATPLLSQGEALGAISVRKNHVHPFSDRQIALLQTFADQAVIAIENARLFEEVQARTRELTQSLEQQTATSEVLGVISSSPGALQPVFDTMLSNAVRICEAKFGNLLLHEGDAFRFVAMYGAPPAFAELRQRNPVVPAGTVGTLARIAATKQVQHVADITKEQPYLSRNPAALELADVAGARTLLAVPMLKDNDLIGGIGIYRQEVRPFSDKQIELVKNFATQPVIAIENTRLLNELRESLQQQTATADVLKVISRSAFDLKVVLNTLVESAARLCEADMAGIMRPKGDAFEYLANFGFPPEYTAFLEAHLIPPGPGSLVGRTLLEAKAVQIADVLSDPEYKLRELAQIGGQRTMLGVPLLREGTPIGVIILQRKTVHPFSDKQIELLTTFADQAVIAIENTRLFEEVQTRTGELQDALDYQTATSEILGIISRSPTDVQPVFDVIARNAVRLCAATYAMVFRFDGSLMHLSAHHNVTPEGLKALLKQWPMPLDHRSVPARAVLERRIVHVHDVQTEANYPYLTTSRALGIRTMLIVPMLRDGEPIGAVAVYRQTVEPFSDQQVALVATFASQAVIAVENVRLFNELDSRNRDLTALGDVGRAVSSTLALKVVLKTIADRAVELSRTDGGSIFYFRDDIGRFQLGETTGLDEEVVARVRELDIAAGQTGLDEAIAKREPLQMPDILERASNPLRDAAIAAGFRAALIVPLLSGDGPLGALVLQRRRPGKFPPAVVSLMQSFADQSAIALENARLFEEIAQKSRELEIASQHKSQFVANMSHELRTPLAAILGYAELIQEGFYGPHPEKSMDALTRIRSNGKHLLGLINTVLDIAKIESGQFTLNMTEYAIESVVETVRSATESLAQNKKLALKTEVAKSLPIGLGDEQRLTQVLLNLVGNAIKF